MKKKLDIVSKSTISNKLLQTLGIDVMKDGHLKDQDTLSELVADQGKLIKYIDPDIDPEEETEATFVNRNIEVPFNPFIHHNVLQLLTSYFIGKIEEDEDVYYSAMTVERDKESGKQSVVLTDNFGRRIASGFYFNLAIAYMDIIFRLDEQNMSTVLILHDVEPSIKKRR